MTLTVLLFWIYLFLLTLIFVLQWLSLHGEILIMLLSQFHLLSNKLKTGCPISSHAYSHANWDGLCDHLRVFHGRISLNAMLLLLLVNFLSEFRLELMYISLIISIKSNLTHLHGFACAAVIVHRNHFFWLYQQNKSSEFKVQTG